MLEKEHNFPPVSPVRKHSRCLARINKNPASFEAGSCETDADVESSADDSAYELPAGFCNAWNLSVASETTEFVSAQAEITYKAA